LKKNKGKILDRGEEVRALIKLRCGNLERANKYWLGEEAWTCIMWEREGLYRAFYRGM